MTVGVSVRRNHDANLDIFLNYRHLYHHFILDALFSLNVLRERDRCQPSSYMQCYDQAPSSILSHPFRQLFFSIFLIFQFRQTAVDLLSLDVDNRALFFWTYHVLHLALAPALAPAFSMGMGIGVGIGIVISTSISRVVLGIWHLRYLSCHELLIEILS